MATADKLITVAENVPKVYHAGQMTVVENAECLKGSKTDTAMLLDDVSPVTHDMSVKVRGKNLLSNLNYILPANISTETGYSKKVYLKSGLSYTFSIASISGATSWRLIAHIYENGTIVSAGADSILNSSDWFTGNLSMYCPKNANYFMNQSNLTVLENITFNITALKDCAICFGIYLGDTSTETISNNAQLELGTKATDYEPYNSDIQNVHSKNLIPYPYAETTKTVNGVTFTDNGNGTITVNGTTPSDSGASFILSNIDIPIKAGIYTTSGCVSGSNSSGDNIMIMVLAQDDYNIYDLADTGSNKTATIVSDSQIINLSIQIPPNITLNNAVFKPQLEYGSTATAYAKYHEPYPLVVSRYGKNLWDKDYASSLSNWYIIPNGAGYCRIRIKIPKGTQYTVSYQKKLSTGLGLYFYINNQKNFMYHSSKAGSIRNTITLTDSQGFIDVVMAGYPSLKKFMENIGNDLQIEISPTATSYEPYIAPTEYTPTADGTVEGVESLYPSTTLLTNDPYGKVYIDCDYYKDIDKTFNELTTSVALSGGE